METVNERSCCFVTVSFFDEDGLPVVPESANYRIDDTASKTNMVPSTDIAPLGESVRILITADQNAIINSARAYELREMDVTFIYFAGTRQGTAPYQYQVKNLFGLT